jgi:membrane-bound lytic murein transglycosylase A
MKALSRAVLAALLGATAACAVAQEPIARAASRWQPVDWSQIPGFEADALQDAWMAWTRSCARPAREWAVLCREVRALVIADDAERRAWMMAKLQPYRVEGAHFEPELAASRVPQGAFVVPLHRPPADLARRQPWLTRAQIDTDAQAQALLQGRAIAYLDDPIAAMSLHIQGTGRLNITETDGRTSAIRVAFAGSNGHPYRSVGRWLLDQGLIADASWPGIRAWARANPGRVPEMLAQNPRYVFFKEEPLDASQAGVAGAGPRGAQGVALTAGRSIAIDPRSIPYGTPVWLATIGPTLQTQRLVLAQDTGAAITGAVRADFYAGSGPAAGELAGRLKQPLAMWVLWPR